MAMQIVSSQESTGRYTLPITSVDDISERLVKAIAIADLLGAVDIEQLASDTVTNAAWALQDILRDTHDIVNSRTKDEAA